MARVPNRETEWFVPRFGPRRFRHALGLLFLPYTGMVLSYTVWGSVLAPQLHWDRLWAILIIYFLGLGVAAHALDALGSKETKPWGNTFSKRQLWFVSIGALSLAYGTALYYIIFFVPLLVIFAVVEGFFVFAYNLEWFRGKFHSDRWFAFSWGFLPVLTGFCMQTNGVGMAGLIVGLAAYLFSLIEIKCSRPYKDLKRRAPSLDSDQRVVMDRYETLLKCVSLGVCLLGLGLLLARIWV